MNVSAFLRGGELSDIMWRVLNYRDLGDMLKERQFSKNELDAIIKMYKNKKIVLMHLGHTKKFRAFGPPSSDKLTAFDFEHNGTILRLTVDEYFSLRAKSDSKYSVLKYPLLPTVTTLSIFYMTKFYKLIILIDQRWIRRKAIVHSR